MISSRSASRTDPAADSEALQRVALGEVGALGAVYDRHARALLDFAARMAGRADAEDIVHTVFVRAARLAGVYDHRFPSARSWLYGITSKVIQERRRSFVRTVRALMRSRPGDAPESSQVFDHRASPGSLDCCDMVGNPGGAPDTG